VLYRPVRNELPATFGNLNLLRSEDVVVSGARAPEANNMPASCLNYGRLEIQHLKQIAGALLTDDPARGAAKAVIVEEVERLHWRIWNGKAKDAHISIDRIRTALVHLAAGGRDSPKPPIAMRSPDGDMPNIHFGHSRSSGKGFAEAPRHCVNSGL